MHRSLIFLAALMAMIPAPAASAAESPPAVYLVGDSTMCDYDTASGNPQRGWGQFIGEFLVEGVAVHNHASGGRSTKSFIDEGRWEKVIGLVETGDWVVIQFGHNDQKKDKPEIYAPAATDYRVNLTRFVEETRAKGAFPILATSIYRLRFDDAGAPKSTHGAYPQSMRDLAKELDVPLIDLQEATRAKLAELGPEGSKPIFLHFEPGELPAYPNGKHDNSHLSEHGARLIAGMFAQTVRAQNVALSHWLKPVE